jgi:fructosamine-3-kinase
MAQAHKSLLTTLLYIPQVTSKNSILEIEAALGHSVVDIIPLSGGCIGQVYQVTLDDGSRVVAKVDAGENSRLDIEGYMLRVLREQSDLPVPSVWHNTPQLLIMSFLEGESHFPKRTQEHAAELLAHLHQVMGPAFGLEKDTLIGGLHQPNPWTDSWVGFFREQRLLYMGRECLRTGRFPTEFFVRLERFADKLERWLLEPEFPSLIHGDVWTSNVLADGERVTGFVDPAIYFAAPEIELAFTTLFGTFGEWFFARYQELAPLQPGFFEERRDIYNLYPLLVHVRLFGDSYLNGVDSTLRRFGF